MTFSKLDFWLIRLRRPVSRGDRAIHRLAWLAAIAFVLFVLAPRPRRSFPCDLYQMWVAGQAITTMPMGNIYSGIGRLVAMEEFRIRAQSIQSPSLRTAVTDRSLMDITATPLLLATIHLFGSKNFETELWWFRAASAAVYGLGFLALAAALGFSGLWALGLVVLFTNHFWPYHMNMMVANVSALQAGLFMLVLALLRGATPARQGLIGLLLGLLTVAKPTLAPAPIVLLASYAADRRKPDALWFSAGLAVAGVLGVLIPWWDFGTACTWNAWRTLVPPVLLRGWWLTGGFLGKLIGLRDPRIYSAFSVLLMAGATFAFVRTKHRMRRYRRDLWTDDVGAAALGAAIGLLSSPIVHSHYFLVAAPAALAVLRPNAFPSAATPWRTPLGFFAVFLMGFHPLFRSLGLTVWPNHSLLTYLGLGILVGLLLDQRRTSVFTPVPQEGPGHQGAP